jgi:hypothetical protein
MKRKKIRRRHDKEIKIFIEGKREGVRKQK